LIATSLDEPFYASSHLLMFESRATTAPLCCMAEQPLSGKVLVVVGGTTGLGLSAARAFVATHGADTLGEVAKLHFKTTQSVVRTTPE